MSRAKTVSKPSMSPETPAHLVSIRASPYSTGVRFRLKGVLTDKIILIEENIDFVLSIKYN